jgi:hypothetical protein
MQEERAAGKFHRGSSLSRFVHSITSSARVSSVGGIVMPTACDAEKRAASGMGGARIESLARTYERPALRKPFAAFPADSKVA